MANWEFFDDYDDRDRDEHEPSFSIYDFKKWLESQDNDNFPSLREDLEEKKIDDKEALKEEFKSRMKNKVQKNVEKKLADKKRKKK